MSENEGKQRTYLPACWDDDLRMNAMFSVFRSKEVNPNGWQEKMNFWVNLVSQYCRETGRVSMTASEVRAAFERNKKLPNCIEDVLAYMRSQNLLLLAEEFTVWEDSSTWLGWGYSLLKKPVVHGYSAVKSMLFTPEKGEERFIVLDNVKNAAHKVFEKHAQMEKHGEADYVVPLDDFRNTCDASGICRKEDFRFVLVQLQRERRIVLVTENEEQFIKFKNGDVETATTFTNVDKAVLQLRKASSTVSREIDMLEKEIEKCIAEAKEFSKAGSRNKAMLSLKKKKRLEIELKKKVSTADNLEMLLIQLKNSGSEKVVIDAYNTGVDAMKASLKRGLDLDRIDTVMSDLEGLISDVGEVSTTLSKSMAARHEDELMELEEELEEMMKEDNEQNVAKLPAVQNISNFEVEEDDDELLRQLEELSVPTDSPPTKVHTPQTSHRSAAL